jgi:hypothetical protein
VEETLGVLLYYLSILELSCKGDLALPRLLIINGITPGLMADVSLALHRLEENFDGQFQILFLSPKPIPKEIRIGKEVNIELGGLVPLFHT